MDKVWELIRESVRKNEHLAANISVFNAGRIANATR